MEYKNILLFLAISGLTYLGICSALPNKRDPSTLIVGGEEANPGEIPWMVDIRRTAHTCGANLVNSYWAVTAAHCTQSAVSEYTLVAGDHDINQEEGTEQRRSVERIVNHPNYRPGTYENDISLMKVSVPFELNARVQPAPLPAAGFLPTEITTAAGWGRTAEGGVSSPVLLKVDVPYVTDEQCRVAYGGNRIVDSMICAGSPTGGKDACQGDSGGPLMCNRGGTNFLCGIVSWGSGCARPNYPGVYTEVSYFAEWINSVINAS